MLVLGDGRDVSVDRLIQAIWNDDPPASARTQVAICVSALRRAFAAADVPGEVVATTSRGYRLAVPIDCVDAHQAHALVVAADAAEDAGDLAAAATRLREALALWRGAAFADLHSELLAVESARYEEWQLALTERCLGLRLRLGEAAAVAGDLRALVEQHPFRERLRTLLMTALYRTGRRADALAAFRQGRRLLIDELGLEPSAETRAVHDEILRDSAGPGRPQLAPRPVPSDDRCFVGRDAELSRLDRWLDDSAGTSGPVIRVVGPAGMGKTSLVVRWIHRVAPRFGDGPLFLRLDGSEPQDPLPPAEILRRLLRAMSARPAPASDGVEELGVRVREVLADERVLVILDAVQSAAQLREVLPALGHSMVVITSRSRLDELAIRGGAETLALGPMTRQCGTTLLAHAAGSPLAGGEASAGARLVELCDGLPLALRIVAARIAARPDLTPAQLVNRLRDPGRRLSELSHGGIDVRNAFAGTYLRLPEREALLFRRLGLLASPYLGVEDAAALVDGDMCRTDEVLGALADVHLVAYRHTDVHGWPRYEMASLGRLYARERAFGEESRDDLRSALRRVGEASRAETGRSA